MSVLPVQRKTITLTASGGAGSATIDVADVSNCIPFYEQVLLYASKPG
jgi:hypothetical protein